MEEIEKKLKRGIVYLSTIPPYMNVTKIREIFAQYGKIERVYMVLAETDIKLNQPSKVSKKKKFAKKFIEGWVEFERKSVAKKVALLLNNKQVNTRKKSKHFDHIWNIKYLPNFKWVHLHERLAYEKATRRQKLRAEIELAKKKSNYFSANLDKYNKNKRFINKEFMESSKEKISAIKIEAELGSNSQERKEFLKSLFN